MVVANLVESVFYVHDKDKEIASIEDFTVCTLHHYSN